MTEQTMPPALMSGFAFQVEAAVTHPDGTTDADDSPSPAEQEGDGR